MTLSAISGGRGSAQWALKINLPGLTLRASDATFQSKSDGLYPGRILNLGGLNYAISDRSGQMPSVETTALVADPLGEIAAVYTGVNANSVRGSVAEQFLASPDVEFLGWKKMFSGIIIRVGFKDRAVEFTMRTNDDRLRNDTPSGGWIINSQSFPLAVPAVYGKPAPVVYGIFDASTVQTGPGLVPTLLVDTTNYRYLVSAGVLKDVTLVYVNGTSVSGSTWTQETLTRNGRVYTCIKFSSGFPAAADVVTCDCEGFEDVGDGSGDIITNPVAQLRHRLSNFVLNDYKTGAWFSTDSLINTAAFDAAETYLADLTASGSDWDGEARSGSDVISRFCISWRMRSWWSFDGKISIGYEDLFSMPYTGVQLKWHRDELGAFSMTEEDFQVTSRITVNSLFSASQGVFLHSFEVTDPTAAIESQSTLDLLLSEAR